MKALCLKHDSSVNEYLKDDLNNRLNDDFINKKTKIKIKNVWKL